MTPTSPRPWRQLPRDLFVFATTELHDLHVAIMCLFQDTAVLQPALGIEEVRSSLEGVGWDEPIDGTQLDQALAALVRWNLLEVSQNHAARYATPEEFERRNLQWSLSAQGQAAIGGVLHALEALRHVAGLQPAVVEAIADALADLRDLLGDPAGDPGRVATRLAEVEAHLGSLVTSVRQFNTQLQRLMREDALSDEVFHDVKSRTVAYLREYIEGVDRPVRRVQSGIQRLVAFGVQAMFERALIGANLAPVAGEDSAPAWRAERARHWAALRAWFAPEATPVAGNAAPTATPPPTITEAPTAATWAPGTAPAQPKIAALVELARRAIVELLRVLEIRMEARRRSVSVAQDFRALAVLFAAVPAEAEAHRLFNAAFGLWPARHAHLGCPDEDAIPTTTSWSDAPPVDVPPVLRLGGLAGTPVRSRPVGDPARLRAARQAEQAAALGRAIALRGKLATPGPVRLSSFGILPTDAFRELLDLVGQALSAPRSSDGAHRALSADGQVEVVLRDPADGRMAHLGTEAGIMAAPDFLVQVSLLDVDVLPALEALGG